MTAYVAGFLFSDGHEIMAVIEKRKPVWQAGKLNAIGGKIESNETALGAMIREFEEEAGVRVLSWKHLATLNVQDGGHTVEFFVAFDSASLANVRTVEAESVHLMPVSRVLHDDRLLPNLKVLIPLALDTSGIVRPVILHDESPGK